MIKIDLITGFLGSGKTTFIKKYASYCLDQGENIAILEKDYGSVNVDMMLLQDLIGDKCDLEMVPPAFDADCQRRRFKSKLITLGMCGYDRIIMEPSGIYDVDEFFEVLSEDPLNRWFEIDNVISIVDAGLEEELSEESDYLLAAQIAKAGRVVFSKSQLVTEQALMATKRHLIRALGLIHLDRDLDQVIMVKDWDRLAEEDFKDLLSCGYCMNSHIKYSLEENNSFTSLYYMNSTLSVEEWEEKIARLMKDPTCGNIIRVKGFLCETDDDGEHWFQINVTKKSLVRTEIPKGQKVFIVIGEHLDKEKVDAYFS